MKPRTALLGLSLALASLPLRGAAADGAEIYRRKCASCHGADGAGGKQAAPLTTPEVLGKSDEELFAAVAKGTPDRKMPPYRGRLADDEIRAAVAYVRTLKR